MALFGRKKVQPLKCRWQDVYDLMQESIDINVPILELTIQIENKSHTIGISSDTTCSGEYFDTIFFFDEREYTSMNDLFSALGYSFDMIISVIKEEGVVDPRDFTLLAQREIF